MRALAMPPPASTAPVGWVEDRQFGWLVTAVLVFGFLWPTLPGGLEFDAAKREEAVAAGSGLTPFALLWLPLILAAMGIFVARFRLLTQLVRDINPWLLLLLVWNMLSAIWSPMGAFSTFKQAFSIFGVTVIATAFTLASWRVDKLERVLMPVMMGLMIASVLAAVLVPSVGIHSENAFELAGSWRGITYQKNGLGQLSAVAVIFWWHSYLSGERTFWRTLPALALAVFLLLKSRSSTSLLLSMIACVAITIMLRPPLRLGRHGGAVKALITLSLLLPLVVYLLLVGSVDSAVLAQSFGQIFGKDATFSGRTYIWAELLVAMKQHLLFGVGFNSFWAGPGSPSDEAVRRLGWPVPNGHSGYLDMINEVGLIGFGLFVAVLVRQAGDLARIAKIDRAQAALHWAILIYVSLANLTETGWFKPISFLHVIAIYSFATVSRQIFELRLRLSQPPPARVQPLRTVGGASAAAAAPPSGASARRRPS